MHRVSTDADAAFDQVTSALSAYSQPQKELDAKINDQQSNFSAANYKLVGISYDEAVAKIEPILDAAGFKERKSRFKSVVFTAPLKHGGFVMLDDTQMSASDPELLFFTVTRPKR